MSANGTGPGLSGFSSDELRAEVRAVLRELLPAVTRDAAAAGTPTAGTTEAVPLRTDADVDAFARRIAALCEDPAQRAAIRDGRRRFRLAGTTGDAGTASTGTGAATGGVMRVDRGAVTERRVAQAAAAGARLVVGRRAVLTPLARDRARTLGVVIEKEG
jgi:hypothetical protein